VVVSVAVDGLGAVVVDDRAAAVDVPVVAAAQAAVAVDATIIRVTRASLASRAGNHSPGTAMRI
jgi:hypothetical protein